MKVEWLSPRRDHFTLVETAHCTRRLGGLVGSGSVWKFWRFEKCVTSAENVTSAGNVTFAGNVTSAGNVTHDWGLNVGGSWKLGVRRGSGVALHQHG